MADPTYNGDLQTSTLDDMLADAAYDNFFVETAYQQHMRAIGAVDPFGGGVLMREPFIMGSPAAGHGVLGRTLTSSMCSSWQTWPSLHVSIPAETCWNAFSLSVQNKGRTLGFC